MILKEILSQHRRDFTGILKCEFCGEEENLTTGYDDDNYHQNGIPNMKCKKCQKSTVSENQPILPTETKYPPWQQV